MQKDIFVADDIGAVAEPDLAHPIAQVIQETPAYKDRVALGGRGDHERSLALLGARLLEAANNLIHDLIDGETIGIH